MPPLDEMTLIGATLSLGALLAAALVAGGLGDMLRLPKVTSYLLVGVLIGPSVLDWIPPAHIRQLEPITKLAIALVLFNLGCAFPLARARRIFRRTARLSLGELSGTFVCVVGGLLLIGEGVSAALLLGALALATAPATTILMLKETQSEGPVTEYTAALVAINNLVCIVLFEAMFVGVHFIAGKLDASLSTEIGRLALDLFGSAVLGLVGGLAIGFFYGLVDDSRRLVLLATVLVLLLGVCLAAGLPYLLTFLAMGVTVANCSYHTQHIVAELDRLTGVLCVVFFVTHGAELDLHRLYEAGIIGVGYIALRLLGKSLGAQLAARAGREEPAVRDWLGTTLLAQAGAAIALSAIAARRDPELGGHLQTVILGTVVVFELLGPLAIRYGLLRAGEVPLAHAIHHPTVSFGDQFRAVLNRLRVALGRDPWGRRPEADLTINDLMRKNVKALPRSATFEEVIRYIEQSRDNTFPVIDNTNALVGLIRYRQLSHALFDRDIGPLVRAEDLAVPGGRALHPDDPVEKAHAVFAASKDDCIPVIERDVPHRLLGIVRRRDVLRMLVRRRGG